MDEPTMSRAESLELERLVRAAGPLGSLTELKQIAAEIVALREGLDSAPITAGELMRRGTDDDLHIRAIDVIYRCGFPRLDAPLGVECVPVPVETMERMLDTARDIRGEADAVRRRRLIETFESLLEDHDTIRTAYTTAREAGLIPELRGQPQGEK